MEIYLLYGHLPTGIRKNLLIVASPFYTDCQSLAAQRWQLERALVRHPILDEGTKRTNNQFKKGMISPNFKQKCSFFCPNIYFDQTQAISFRSILIQNFWVVSGSVHCDIIWPMWVRQVLARETSPGCLIKGCPFYGAICQIILGGLWYCWWKKIPNNHLRCMETLYVFHIWDTANSPLKFLRYPEHQQKPHWKVSQF